MPSKRNLVAATLSFLAGLVLIVSGTNGPIGIYLIILDKLPLFINDTLILSVTAFVALFLIVLSSLGGFTVIIGGYLVYKSHITTGKLLIGLGAGVGIPWLIFMLFTVMASQELSSVITQHSVTGWIGIIASFVARLIAKKPARHNVHN
jgi:hypothetical protein